ncbi:hypothetical protein V6N13_059598 [Hibiscus sabdariffa]
MVDGSLADSQLLLIAVCLVFLVFMGTSVTPPKSVLCSGGNPSAYIPTHTIQNSPSSALFSGNIWRNLSSWMPQREISAQSAQDDSRFPGRGRTLGSVQIAAGAGGSQMPQVASEEQIQKLA